MKPILCSVLLIIASTTVVAQLTINAGAQLSFSGTIQLTLQDINFVSNGTFSPGTSVVSFTGNTNSTISGSGAISFYNLEINKAGSNAVQLQNHISVLKNVSFTSGLINLNGFNLDLGTTGSLIGESETSHITGSSGGQVLFSTTLNNPSSVNPGNLGAIITSSQNLGNVIIKRGHQSQVNGFGNGATILRYYDIQPSNNTALNATLRFLYLDAELNSLSETGLQLWKSTDNIHWNNQGVTSSNAISNYIEKTGITDFSRWTLSMSNNPLPVQFVLLNSRCDNGKFVLSWRTAQEQNSSRFIIERSYNGRNWTTLTTINAAGNSSTRQNYSVIDNNPASMNFYRIILQDINGAIHYSGVLKSSCGANDIFSVYPNPANTNVTVSVYAVSSSKAIAKLYDSKGALVKTMQTDLLQGNNQFTIDMINLAAGNYHLSVQWNNGTSGKIVSLIKN